MTTLVQSQAFAQNMAWVNRKGNLYSWSHRILASQSTSRVWSHCFSHLTDIGGILAHGSIVARECGIPAVMGTGNVGE